MSEIGDVLAAIEALSAKGERMALATIVAVRGSTYRRPGARLLVPEEGAPVEPVRGCLEGDVADMARVVMEEGRARLAGWDRPPTTTRSGARSRMQRRHRGLHRTRGESCRGGRRAARGARRGAADQCRDGGRVVLPGRRTGVATRRSPRWNDRRLLGTAAVDAEAVRAAEALLREERSEVRILADGVRAFVEVLDPPLRLLVCGAGHDAILVRAASVLGWNVMVADDRPAFLTRERFPEASGFVAVDDPADAAKEAGVDDRTFVVVMSHHFLRDKEYVRSMLGSPAAYIGTLGPGARTERLLMELRDEGVEAGDAARQRIQARRPRPRRRRPGGDRAGHRRGDRRGQAAPLGRLPP